MADVRASSPRVETGRDPGTTALVRANPLMQAVLGHLRQPRLSVLIYHRVLAARDPLRPSEPTAMEFETRMKWVKRHFNVLSLGDAVAGLKTGRLPQRPLAITFDDGYADNHDIALPILRSLGLRSTFFVATGFLDGGCMFNDIVIESVRQAKGGELDLSALGLGTHEIASSAAKCRAVDRILGNVKRMPPSIRDRTVEDIASRSGATVPANLMMTSAKVAALEAAGMEIGGHTVTHPILAEVPADQAKREIRDGRERLEAIVGRPIRQFAYPNGKPDADYTAEHVRLVRELGFDGAVSTAWGACRAGADPYQIPRFTPWDTSSWRFGLRLAMNLHRTAYEVA